MIADLHTLFAWIVVFANGIAGVWCLTAHWIEAARSRVLWVFVAVAQVLVFVEVGLGAARLSQLDGDAPEFHTFYGFLCLIAIAILYGYRTQVAHIRHLLYGGGSLFIMGLAIRAMFLDATPIL
ncbi:MAG: hypothetical protein AAF567_13125 [Actinomycetota bacterium]